jgi:hypothetical protein
MSGYASLKGGGDDDGSRPGVAAAAAEHEVSVEVTPTPGVSASSDPDKLVRQRATVFSSDLNKSVRTTSFSSGKAAKDFVRRAEAGKERSRLADDEAVHVTNLAAFKDPDLVAEYEAELEEFFGQFGTVDAVSVRVPRPEESGKKISWALVTFADYDDDDSQRRSAGAADAAILGAAEAAALANSRLSGLIVAPLDRKSIRSSTGMMRQVSVDHATKVSHVRQEDSRERNAELGVFLSSLFWTNPTDLVDDEDECHTWFTWLVGLIVWLFMPVLNVFHAWTFISGWDPNVLALAGFPSSIVYGFVFFKLLEVTHPRTGEIDLMARGPRLTEGILADRKLWRFAFIILSVFIFGLGLFRAFTILTTAAEDLAGLEIAYFSSGSAWRSQSPHAWGGFAGTTVARVVASASTVALYSSFAFVLSPFLYSYTLSYYLATGAARAAVTELNEIDLRPDPITVAETKHVGRLVHTVQNAVLVPFTL